MSLYRIVPDPDFPKGGHALLIVTHGNAIGAGDRALQIKIQRVTTKKWLEPDKGWNNASNIVRLPPQNVTATAEGFEVRLGPDVVNLLDHTDGLRVEFPLLMLEGNVRTPATLKPSVAQDSGRREITRREPTVNLDRRKTALEQRGIPEIDTEPTSSAPVEPPKRVEPPKPVETPKPVDPPVDPPRMVDPPEPVEPAKPVVEPMPIDPREQVDPPPPVRPPEPDPPVRLAMLIALLVLLLLVAATVAYAFGFFEKRPIPPPPPPPVESRPPPPPVQSLTSDPGLSEALRKWQQIRGANPPGG